MLFKLKLKNSDQTVLLDDFVYEHFKKDKYLASLNFLENLRLHSGGYAVFQKAWLQPSGKYKTETIYLHKRVAELFVDKPNTDERLVVRIVNGNRLDCRTKNLEWTNSGKAIRKGNFYNKTGYRGVKKEGSRYRATIFYKMKPIHIGMFDTAEEAALAFNEKSKELFGEDGKLNSVVLNQDNRPAVHKQE